MGFGAVRGWEASRGERGSSPGLDRHLCREGHDRRGGEQQHSRGDENESREQQGRGAGGGHGRFSVGGTEHGGTIAPSRIIINEQNHFYLLTGRRRPSST